MPKITFRPNPTPPPFPPPPTPIIQPLTFTAQENGCRIGYIYYSEEFTIQDAGLNIEYSIDGGQTWLPYTMSTNESGAQMINLDNEETVMFRGNNRNLAYYLDDEGGYQATKFVIEGQIAASGDVSSLLNGIGGVLTAPTHCYAYMFYDCGSLTQAPALRATTLADSCYKNMFRSCASLTQAPTLPATTLADGCYNGMFYNCRSLTQAPTLPATTLADFCYSYMFSGCRILTQAPALPATTLADGCYNGMFYECASLTQAPVLPATTLADSCYKDMFQSCASLTQAPTLPATTLADGCYNGMFKGCTLLSYIEASFTTIPGENYTSEWVRGVAQNGTFVKSSEATWDVSGVNGIPTGWTVTTN